MPAPDLRPGEPPGVGLVVDLVADPDELAAADAGPQLGDRVGRRPGTVRSTQPTTPPMKDVAAAVARNSRGLAEVAPRLDEDRPVDAVRLEEGRQVVRAEPPPDRRQLVGQERVGRPGRIPEVVVRVDRVMRSAGARGSGRASGRPAG